MIPVAFARPAVTVSPVAVPIVADENVMVSGPGVTGDPPDAVSLAVNGYWAAAASVYTPLEDGVPSPETTNVGGVLELPPHAETATAKSAAENKR
jgi:hypothetical protein